MRILDLFAGAGGAAMGLHQAFPDAEIVGVDIRPQKHYPFHFELADAMAYPLDGFDFIWASPPCQGYSIMRNLPWLRDRSYPLLIDPVQQRLRASGIAHVVENVMGARRHLVGTYLCGTMFTLPFYRHRMFETSFPLLAPAHPRHEQRIRKGGDLGGRARQITWVNTGGSRENPTDARTALGIDWMTRDELSQAVPPAYARYIGEAYRQQLERAA